MADELGNVSLGTEVDLTGLKAGLDDAEGQTKGRLSAMADGLGGMLSGALAGVGIAVGAAVVGGLAAAVDMAGQANQAVNDIQASLGLTRDEAEVLGDVAIGVFGDNFGGSLEDAAASVVEVRQQMKSLGDDEIQGATEKALALRDVFGVEVAESTNTANTLMQNFGLSADQAFDLITAGNQRGLNTSGDFQESIGEYSNLFAAAGFSADEMFSIMQTGMQGGVLGTDKVADAFKELGIRLQDGSATTRDALAGLGLDDVFTGMADGSITVADAFPRIQEALATIEDPVAQAQLGVALFGTQWEDMGASAMLAISTTTTTMADMEGATDSLNAKYDNLGAVGEAMWRQLLTTLMPVGDALLSLANAVMPAVLAGFEWLRGGIETAINAITPVIQTVVSTISGLLAGEGTASLGTWGAAFEQARGLIDGVMQAILGIVGPTLGILSGFWAQHGGEIQTVAGTAWTQIQSIIVTVLQILQETIIPILQTIGGFISAHSADIQTLLGAAWANIQTVVTGALAIIQGIVNTVLAVIRGDWSGAWTEIQGVVTTAIETVRSVIETTLGAILDIWNANQDAIKAKATEVWDGLKGIVETAIQGVLDTVTGMGGRFLDAGRALIQSLWDGITGKLDAMLEEVRRRLQELADLLPGSEPKDPTSPLRGLARRGQALIGNLQAGIDATSLALAPTLDAALGGLNLDAQPLAGAGPGGLIINVPITLPPNRPAGPTELADVDRAVRAAVEAALLRSGRAARARQRLG